jgi:GTP-binding protein
VKINDIRNIAIFAHVDHGKTTLVDQMLRQCGQFREAQLKGERILDSNDLERERASPFWPRTSRSTSVDEDQPDRHAWSRGFGGEVERVLKMADGALLLVDAFEGPMPQTRFVLRKAFEFGLRPIVVINKMDRLDARPKEVLDEVFDLFVELDAGDQALDFPVVYASATQGWASTDPQKHPSHVIALFDTILRHVPAPDVDPKAPLQMLVTTLDYNDYVGRIGVGRVFAGTLRPAVDVALLHRDGGRTTEQVGELFVFDGLGRRKVEQVVAGDICAVVGIESVDIGSTIADAENPQPLPIVSIDEPTLHMTFRVNDSPFAGRSGKYLTSRHLRGPAGEGVAAQRGLACRAGLDAGGVPRLRPWIAGTCRCSSRTCVVRVTSWPSASPR